MNFNDFIARLQDVENLTDEMYSAVCPACGKNSLITKAYYDKISTFCESGCTEQEICHAMNIEVSDLRFPPMARYFKPLFDFEEQEANWLIKNWLPEGQITLLAADGGVGKTTLWCDIAAAISSGRQCILDSEDTFREPKKVMILTTEDSISKKLKSKLRASGANEKNIIALDLQQDLDGEALSSLHFGSKELSSVIRACRPALCIFDPVQGFIPPDINMSSRNAMRSALAPLIPLGEECGTTFLIICHSNKRKGASGRDRIADSADLWDISRSVMMAGYTADKGIRYLSNEKNNYAPLSESILFSINKSGLAEKRGTCSKRDREFMQESMQTKAAVNSAPQRDECKQFIIDTLLLCDGNKIASKELKQLAADEGYSLGTLQRAKDELKDNGEIIIGRDGGKSGVWYTKLGEYFTKASEYKQEAFRVFS